MRNEINMYLCDVIFFNVDDTVRKRPLTKERSEEKEESGQGRRCHRLDLQVSCVHQSDGFPE